MARLLVSVRTEAEARAALGGGAAIVDVKEPTRGSLGRADSEVIAGIVTKLGGRVPLSAAMGELCEEEPAVPCPGLSYAKWGLAGWGECESWRGALTCAQETMRRSCPGCGLVAVAYADWRRAQAPRPQEVCRFTCLVSFQALLVDTWEKDGSTLLDWLSLGEIAHLLHTCRQTGTAMALAGSLGPEQIKSLAPLDPDWFAVRGAACSRGRRESSVSAARVCALANLVAEMSPKRAPVRPRCAN